MQILYWTFFSDKDFVMQSWVQLMIQSQAQGCSHLQEVYLTSEAYKIGAKQWRVQTFR